MRRITRRIRVGQIDNKRLQGKDGAFLKHFLDLFLLRFHRLVRFFPGTQLFA